MVSTLVAMGTRTRAIRPDVGIAIMMVMVALGPLLIGTAVATHAGSPPGVVRKRRGQGGLARCRCDGPRGGVRPQSAGQAHESHAGPYVAASWGPVLERVCPCSGRSWQRCYFWSRRAAAQHSLRLARLPGPAWDARPCGRSAVHPRDAVCRFHPAMPRLLGERRAKKMVAIVAIGTSAQLNPVAATVGGQLAIAALFGIGILLTVRVMATRVGEAVMYSVRRTSSLPRSAPRSSCWQPLSWGYRYQRPRPRREPPWAAASRPRPLAFAGMKCRASASPGSSPCRSRSPLAAALATIGRLVR